MHNINELLKRRGRGASTT